MENHAVAEDASLGERKIKKILLTGGVAVSQEENSLQQNG